MTTPSGWQKLADEVIAACTSRVRAELSRSLFEVVLNLEAALHERGRLIAAEHYNVGVGEGRRVAAHLRTRRAGDAPEILRSVDHSLAHTSETAFNRTRVPSRGRGLTKRGNT